jgi:hypothetical protein
MLTDEDDDDDAAVAPAAAEAPGRKTSQAAHLLNFSSFLAKHASHFHLPSSYFLNISPHPEAVASVVAPLSPVVLAKSLLLLDRVTGVPERFFVSLGFDTTEGLKLEEKVGCGLFMPGGENANCAPILLDS